MKSLVQPIRRHDSQERYTLVSCDQANDSRRLLKRITQCCNEPLIYSMLFQNICGGSPYDESHAQNFFDWCVNGWKTGTFFVFFVFHKSDLPVACCDLKSNNRLDCEIGYWCSADATGVTTNAVAEMLRHASDNGFSAFHAFVPPANWRSQRVLDRLQFKRTASKRDGDHLKYAFSFHDHSSISR